MDNEQFVRAVKVVQESAVRGLEETFAAPPGRKPSRDLLEVCRLYGSLDAKSRATLMKVADLASRQAVNNMFCILDGDLAIESVASKGDLELYFCKDGVKQRLNPSDGHTLSDIYRSV